MNSLNWISRSILKVKDAIRRFPLAVFFGAVIFALIISINNQNEKEIAKSLVTSILFFPFAVLAGFLKEVFTSNKKYWLFNSLVIVVALLFRWVFSESILTFELKKYVIELAVWFGVSVSTMIIAPLVLAKRTKGTDLWQFTREVVIAICIAFLTSGILFAGISIALSSIGVLFKISFPAEVYRDVWAFFACIVAVLVFTSNLPDLKNLTHEPNNENFPKDIRILAGKILFPLVGLYFLILNSYTLKILITQSWPSGVVSWMISGFSVFGLVVFFALYPLYRTNNFYRKSFNIFFVSLIPQVIVLYWAVYLRFSEYGITENRLFLLIFGLWLLWFALYFLISKKKNLLAPFIVLAVGGFLLVSMPYNVFSITQASQLKRFEKILSSEGVIVDGKYQEGKIVTTDDAKQQSVEILYYLSDTHGLKKLKVWFGKDYKLNDLIALVGAQNGYDSDRMSNSYYVQNNSLNKIDIQGYDWYISDFYNPSSINEKEYQFIIDKSGKSFKVSENGQTLADISLDEFFSKIRTNEGLNSSSNSLPNEEMQLKFENELVKVKVIFSNITFEKDEIITNQVVLFKVK